MNLMMDIERRRSLTARELARFGARLRELREENSVERLSQRELARRTGLSPTTISELEDGRHEPRLGTLLVLAEGLAVGSIEELLGPMPSRAWLKSGGASEARHHVSDSG